MGANAQTSVPAFTAGQVLTAAQMTQVNTGIPVFASSTERDAAFGGAGEKTLAEGQMAYLEDTNATQYYDGAAWSAIAGGKILQVLSTTKTDTFSTTNTTFTDVTGLTVSITPSSASNKVLVIANLVFSYSGTGGAHIKLNGGNTSSYVGDAASNRVQGVSNVYSYTSLRNDLIAWNQPMLYLDSPATTSSTTYAAQVRVGSAGTVYVNRSEEDADTVEYVRGASTITVMEVAA